MRRVVAIAVAVPVSLVSGYGNHLHGVKPAYIETRAALDALVLINGMRLLETAGNRILRTDLEAQATALALLIHDYESNHLAASPGRAEILIEVLFILGTEVTQGTDNRVRGRLTQTTQ